MLALAIACTLATLQLAVANECGIVVVQEDQLKQDIRREVDTALVSLLRATGGQPPAETNDDQCEVELREEIKKDVNEALEQTVMNVTGVCEFGIEFDKLKLRSDRLEENMRDLKLGLREVNATVESAIETVVDAAVEAAVERVVSTTVEAAVEKATRSIEQLLQSLVNDTALLKKIQLGYTPAYPADSCAKILNSSPSGYYWLRAGNGSSVRVYCDMTRTCGGITGGWMQVANIDMTNSSHTCPQGLKTLTSPKRLCGINISGKGCSSTTFAVHGVQYTHICGKVIGYQYGATNAFFEYSEYGTGTIDDSYVTGVSFTHSRSPRKHIWTLAGAVDESVLNSIENCPCTNTALVMPAIPPWVGDDYFCDTAVETWRSQFHLYPDDPLWDGEGCGPTSTCCSFNNPPWFSKQLPSPTTDDIEMRLCGYYRRNVADVQVEVIELYAQ